MSNSNIVTATFNERHLAVTTALYAYDYGQVLQFSGVELPEYFEVHFANEGDRATTAQLGQDNQVNIPNELLETGKKVVAYIYLHDTVADGETMYKVIIPVRQRPSPDTTQPTPSQQEALAEAIVALNEAAEHYPQIVDGYWYVWDATEGEYVNTNVKAEGATGLPGEVQYADIAPVFSAASSYKAGDYVFYSGALYCFTADHAAGAWTGTDVAAANIADDVSSLETAVSDNTGATEITSFTKDKYIKTDGSTVDVTALIDSSSHYRCAVVNASEGDVFTINGTGGSSARLWCFIDASGNSLLVASANNTANNFVIVAPANSAKLVINQNSSYGHCYIGIPVGIRTSTEEANTSYVFDAYENLIDDSFVVLKTNDFAYVNKYLATDGTLSGDVNYARCTNSYYKAKAGSIFYVNNPMYRLILCTYSSNSQSSFIAQLSSRLSPIGRYVVLPYDCYVRFGIISFYLEEVTDAVLNSLKANVIVGVKDKFEYLPQRAFVFTRGALIGGVPGSIGNEQASEKNVRSYNSVYLKAGSKIVCNDANCSFRAFEFGWYNGGAPSLIAYSDFVHSYVVKNDSYVRLSVKNDNSEIIDLSTTINLVSVYGNAPKEKNMWRFLTTKVPQKWYTKSGIHFDDIWNISVADFYARYDDLVTNFPDYVSKEDLGMDATNTYHIYAYSFIPYQVLAENEGTGISPEASYPNGQVYKKSVLPTVLLTSCLHGFERPAAIALNELMYDVCNNWANDESLDFIRHHIAVKIIPIVNPYGFTAKTRYNGNHVDINRNFNTDRWSAETNGSTDPTNERYRGASAASEAETQIVQNWLCANLPAIAFFDVHTHGVLNAYQYMTHFAAGSNSGVSIDRTHMQYLGNEVTLGLTASGYKKGQYAESVKTIGLTGIGTSTSSCSYYAARVGLMSAAPEGMYRIFPAGETEHPSVASMADNNVISTEAKELNVEYVANIILGAYRLYRRYI